MASTHTVDPRTGCWLPAEGHTAESVYELYRIELPHGAELVQLCPTDGCVSPDHRRPTLHVSVDDVADELARLDGTEATAVVAVTELTPAEIEELGDLPAETEVPEVVVEPAPEPAPAPAPQAPIKRGPGRPRKNPR